MRHSNQIPGRTTIWNFKERLIQAGASESIFDAVNRQLSIHGYMARGGQMIDASIVQTIGQRGSSTSVIFDIFPKAMNSNVQLATGPY